MATNYINAACSIYCEGPVLQAVQLAQIYNDSKTFVDMPMKYDPNVTLAAFNSLADPNDVHLLETYLNEYFLTAGTDLNTWVPTDFTNDPAFLDYITDMDYKSWASDLNQLWLILGREVNETVKENPQRHSYIPRSYPMIVPGGRFRESYYWDSWWIVRGLLVCDMETTAQYVINNLLGDVDTFGFVPNGGRIYYLDRSQPPLLSEMVRSYTTYMLGSHGTTPSIQTYLTSAFKTLTVEYSFWMNEALGHCVTLPLAANAGNTTTLYRLNRYYSNYTTPRPESYLADCNNAHASGRSLADFYHQVRAGAETGWDFSSRWISPDDHTTDSTAGYNITNINTNQVIPVDLNSIMYKFEVNMAYFAGQLAGWAQSAGNSSQASTYSAQAVAFTQAAANRSAAIDLYLWDGAGKHWRDYNLTSQGWTHTEGDTSSAATRKLRGGGNALSSGSGSAISGNNNNYSTVAYWVPLWAGLRPMDGTTADQLVGSLQRSGVLQAGGVLTTTVNTGQQWDSPDAWPPEVMFTIEGLQSLATTDSLNLANELSQLWLNTCYIAYHRTGFMYEKYNAFEVGVGGGGGEYTPQKGFGWSNAVALLLLQQTFPPPGPDSSGDGGGSSGLDGAAIIAISCAAVFVGLLLGGWLFMHVFHPVPSSTARTTMVNGVNLQPISPQVVGANIVQGKHPAADIAV